MGLCLPYLALALSEKTFLLHFTKKNSEPVHARCDITNRSRTYNYYDEMCKCVFQGMVALLVIITVQEKDHKKYAFS